MEGGGRARSTRGGGGDGPATAAPLAALHHQAGDAVLLDKATDLGDRLAKAFASPSGLPYTTISLSTGQHTVPSWTGGNLLLAEVGTVQSGPNQGATKYAPTPV